MSLQTFLDISQAPDRVTFRRRMIDFAHWMDFPLVGAVWLTEREDGSPDSFRYIGNRSPDFVAASDKSLALIDPVSTQLRSSAAPFAYDQKYYVDGGAPELWEIAAPYGYRTGISVALRVFSRRQLLFGLDRERDLPTNGKLERLLLNLERFAAYTADGVQRFLDAETWSIGKPELTEREREILLRILEGKSNWVISHLMNISENTVKFHVKKIFRKMDVSSRVVAATRAQVLGLL